MKNPMFTSAGKMTARGPIPMPVKKAAKAVAKAHSKEEAKEKKSGKC